MKNKLKTFSGRILSYSMFGAVLSLFLFTTVSAKVIDDLTQALKSGTPSLELRLSYEYSDLDDPADHDAANALTLRTRLGYRSGDFMTTNAFLQFHDMANPIDEYRWPGGGDGKYDVVADPDGTRVHQTYLDVNCLPDTTFRLGRQEIVLDDARLIGNVDWRQNGQSFDAVSITNKSISSLTLSASYIDRVNTILLTKLDLDGLFLFNAKYSGFENQNISAFCYLLETESKADTARDSATYGVRVNGMISLLNYDLTYAHQSDYEDGEDHNGDMFNAFFGTKIDPVSFGVGYSYISGQDGEDRPFDTLFSTAHKFNGWADTFLNTNGGTLSNGLQDFYVQAETKLMGVTLKAVYHYFDTNEDVNNFDDAYGEEIDIILVKKINKNLKLLMKYAHYNEKNDSGSLASNLVGGFDEDVFWARLIYSF